MPTYQTPQQHKQYNSALYKVVFGSMATRFAAFLILAFMLIQPIAIAFAQTADDASTTPIAIDMTPAPDATPSLDAQTPLPDASPDSQQPTDTQENTSSTTSTVQLAETSSVNPTSSNASSSAATSTAHVSSSTIVGSSSSAIDALASTSSVSTDASTSTEASTATSSSQNNEQSLGTATTSSEQDGAIVTSTDSDQQTLSTTTNDVLTSDASSTEDASSSSSTQQLTFSEHSSHAFEFNASDCAIVGSGAYYCSTAKNAPTAVEDGVFAAPDSGGDMEIYVRLAGKETQLTSNDVEDSAPFYDAQSDRIVWQSMVNDRYQIQSYDLKTNEQVQLTHTSYNNMQPVAYGNLVIWQAWIQNNWEIMMFDGASTTRLTNNAMQDVSPHMRSGYIVWQTQFSDGWQVAVYDTKTKQTEYVKTDEGAKVENPRFVLVYDSTDAAGDVKTVGYDPDKKISFTLNSIPADVPEKLPEPDQTGQPRALLQVKTTSKDSETELNDLLQPHALGSSTPPQPNPTSTSATNTLVIGPQTQLSTSTASVTASSTVALTPNATSSDLIVPPYIPPIASTTSVIPSASSTIPDVVVEPLQATSS